MKTKLTLGIIALLSFYSCQKNDTLNAPISKSSDNWRNLSINEFSDIRYKSNEDPFKKVCAVVAADAGGALVGGWVGAKFTGGNPWGIGIGALIVGGLASYGASGNATAPTWPTTLQSGLAYQDEYFSNSNNQNFYDPLLIDHNELLVLSANQVLNNNGTRISIQSAHALFTSSNFCANYSSQTNYVPDFATVNQYFSGEEFLSIEDLLNLEIFNDFNTELFEVYVNNLNNAPSASAFVNYSIAFENAVSNDQDLSQDEKNATLAFCALARASMIYWQQHM